MGVDVEAFFHAATNTITYLVSEPKSKQAAIIDSVLDFDPASGRAETRSAQTLADHIEDRINVAPTHHGSARRYSCP